jgi:hypothetical protein
MRIRLISLALGILLIPTIVSADDHRWDGYTGGSGGTGGSKLFGFHQAAAVALGQKGMRRKFAVVGDFSTQFGSNDGIPVTQFAYMTGVRVMASRRTDKFKASGHVLFGGVYQNDGLPDANDGAVAVGFGVEYIPDPTNPLLKKSIGVRAQVDQVFRMSDVRTDFWRASVGVIVRFGQHR